MASKDEEVAKDDEEVKRQARAARFGIPVVEKVEDEEAAKRRARAARFGIPVVEPKAVPEPTTKGRRGGAGGGKAAKAAPAAADVSDITVKILVCLTCMSLGYGENCRAGGAVWCTSTVRSA